MNLDKPAVMNHDLSLRERIAALTAQVTDRVDKRALRHWSFHVSLSALPSFVFAIRGGWQRPESVLGMLLGVAFFIGLYTALARWTFTAESNPSSLWRRSLRLGTWIRTVWAIVALPGAVMFGGKTISTVLFLPDLYAGAFAVGITRRFGGISPIRWLRIAIAGPDAGVRPIDPLVGDMASLVPTFLVTVVEGFILSAAMFLIAFVCLRILRLVTRRPPASA